MDLPFDASAAALALACVGALCLGVSKTGFPGLAIVNVLLIAELFGAKNSVGIILPLLIVCDLLVYPLFRKYANWGMVRPLLPVTFVAVVAASLLLDAIDDGAMRTRRLLLRGLRPGDVFDLQRLGRDPRVSRALLDGPVDDIASPAASSDSSFS